MFERMNLDYPGLQKVKAALARAGVSAQNMVMVGDQPGTDIRGANAAGIPSALVPTGVNNRSAAELSPEERPTYLLSSLELS